MSFGLPAPSMMVVLSLSIVTFLARPRSSSAHVLELDAEVLGDGLAAGEDRDVLEHGLAAVAVARGLHRRRLERAAQLVHHQRGQRLALDLLRDDQQRRALLGDLLQHGQEVLHARDLLLVDQDVGVLEHDLHALGVGHEVGRESSRGRSACPRPRRGRSPWCCDSSTVMTPSLPTFSMASAMMRADRLVVVGGDGAHLGDHLALDRLAELLQLLDHDGHRLLDALLQLHRVGAGGDVLDALAEDAPGRARWRWWCRRRPRR